MAWLDLFLAKRVERKYTIRRELGRAYRKNLPKSTNMADAKKITMDDLLKEETVKSLASGDVVEGVILSVKKHEVLVDLGLNAIWCKW